MLEGIRAINERNVDNRKNDLLQEIRCYDNDGSISRNRCYRHDKTSSQCFAPFCSFRLTKKHEQVVHFLWCIFISNFDHLDQNGWNLASDFSILLVLWICYIEVFCGVPLTHIKCKKSILAFVKLTIFAHDDGCIIEPFLDVCSLNIK